mmetsp:Transcript_2992/g.4362  ORF Transcript_2992/g.4362 Transcript_2992/m.4362 type:complete len:84 (+) Transcript_2992:247-498(+)
MDVTNHLNECDVRQDQILSIRESDHSEQGVHGDALIHSTLVVSYQGSALSSISWIRSENNVHGITVFCGRLWVKQRDAISVIK